MVGDTSHSGFGGLPIELSDGGAIAMDCLLSYGRPQTEAGSQEDDPAGPAVDGIHLGS